MIQWDDQKGGSHGHREVFTVNVSVYPDGDDPNAWWGSIELPGGGWINAGGGVTPFKSREDAKKAVEEELERRFNLLRELLQGIQHA